MPDLKPYMVAECPSVRGDHLWESPLSGKPAERLCRWAGWPPAEEPLRPGPYDAWTRSLYARFIVTNLFRRAAEADPWNEARATDAAHLLTLTIVNAVALRGGTGTTAVLMGGRVAAAFGIKPRDGRVPYFEWREYEFGRVVVAPHPSGRNRLLNDPEWRERTGAILRDAAG